MMNILLKFTFCYVTFGFSYEVIISLIKQSGSGLGDFPSSIWVIVRLMFLYLEKEPFKPEIWCYYSARIIWVYDVFLCCYLIVFIFFVCDDFLVSQLFLEFYPQFQIVFFSWIYTSLWKSYLVCKFYLWPFLIFLLKSIYVYIQVYVYTVKKLIIKSDLFLQLLLELIPIIQTLKLYSFFVWTLSSKICELLYCAFILWHSFAYCLVGVWFWFFSFFFLFNHVPYP